MSPTDMAKLDEGENDWRERLTERWLAEKGGKCTCVIVVITRDARSEGGELSSLTQELSDAHARSRKK